MADGLVHDIMFQDLLNTRPMIKGAVSPHLAMRLNSNIIETNKISNDETLPWLDKYHKRKKHDEQRNN